MTTVLGTRVHAQDGDAEAAFLISDLHIPQGGGPAFTQLTYAIAAARAARAPLFVLGDLFDSYVCKAQVRHDVWRDVASAFAEAVAAGVRVTVLHGNRDFLLGREFEAASGARVLAGGWRGRLGGVDTLLLHGDELCVNDLPYQRAKRWLRRPLLQAIARRLPLRVALALAARARAKSGMVIRSGDQSRFLPTTAAVTSAMATGVQRLVFGHIHRFAHGHVGGGEYWVLPAFDAAAIGLRCQAGSLAPVRFRDGGGDPVEAPPACPFPS